VKQHFLFVVQLLSVSAFCQPLIDWQKTYGGAGNDIFYELDTAPNGYYIGGVSNSNISGDKKQNSKGANDCWLLSLGSSGQILWQKTIGGALDDGIRSLTRTNDGGLIVGGGSNSDISGDKNEDSRGFSDYWIIKLDNNGGIEWQRTIGGSDADGLRSIRQTADNGYILGGLSVSGISGEKTEGSRGTSPSYDYWILKLDTLGNIEWQKTYGGDQTDDLISIRQTADLGYIVAGNSDSNANFDKTENSRGSVDYWILRLDVQGNIIWQRTYGGSDIDLVTDILENDTNGFYVGGFSYSSVSGDKTAPVSGSTDFWLLNLDSSGDVVWQKTIGGNGSDFLYSLSKNTDHSLLLGGSSNSPISGDKSENSRGLADMWLVKLNESGAITWQKTIGGNQADAIYSIKKTDDNSYILGGFSRSSISGDKNEDCRGETDYWFVKLEPDNLSVASVIKRAVEIFPNPTDGVLTINLPDDVAISDIALADVTGKKITFQRLSHNTISISSEPGIYLLTVITDSRNQSFKIIKN
jgi:hypothetical protein